LFIRESALKSMITLSKCH